MIKRKVDVLREKNNKNYLLCTISLDWILLSFFGTRSEHRCFFMSMAACPSVLLKKSPKKLEARLFEPEMKVTTRNGATRLST